MSDPFLHHDVPQCEIQIEEFLYILQIWNNVVAEIEGKEIKETHLHGILRESHEGNFDHAAVLEVQVGDRQVMYQFIFARGWNKRKDDDRGNQGGEKNQEKNGEKFSGSYATVI